MAEARQWYSKGYGGMKQEEQRLAMLYGPDRLWIKPGTYCEFVLLEDEPFTLHEHNPGIDGEFKNWITCLREAYDEIPCCAILGEKTRYYTGYYTVINCSPWTDNKGNVHQYGIQFLNAKLRALKTLQRKKEERGALSGTLIKAFRTDDKSSSCGDEFTVIREVNLPKLFSLVNYKGKKLVELFKTASSAAEKLEALKKVFQLETAENGVVLPKLVPFNYFELLAPKPPREISAFLKSANITNTDKKSAKAGAKPGKGGGAQPLPDEDDAAPDADPGGEADDDVPF